MEVKIDKIDGLYVVSSIGRLDASNASVFDEKMRDILSHNPEKVVVSLKGLEYVSSAGLRVFLTVAKEMKKTGGKLAFAEPSEQVFKVLKMSGLDTILKIYKTMDEAVSGLQHQ
ncbi:MAG: STAS domain-containing protein [Nitrospirae bacterium]|nr:STAS domain-containing protein [Nitrospirota bacterium]